MIYGERIRLRAPTRDDLPRFTAWLNDPEIRQYITIILPFSIEEEEGWFEAMLKRPKEEHPLVIEARQSGAEAESWFPIGNLGLDDINWRVGSAELGIVIGEKAYWNQGYGGEAIRLMLSHGFEMLNLNRIFLRVFENNPRAIRAYEKVGFVHEGRFRQAEYVGGKYVDILVMSVLREEWLKRDR